MPNAAIAGMTVELEMAGPVAIRYVRLAPMTRALPKADHTPEHCHACLLCHIHSLPTTCNSVDSQDRSEDLPRRHLYSMGRGHDWHGSRDGLDPAYRAACGARHLRGRLLPRVSELLSTATSHERVLVSIADVSTSLVLGSPATTRGSATASSISSDPSLPHSPVSWHTGYLAWRDLRDTLAGDG